MGPVYRHPGGAGVHAGTTIPAINGRVAPSAQVAKPLIESLLQKSEDHRT